MVCSLFWATVGSESFDGTVASKFDIKLAAIWSRVGRKCIISWWTNPPPADSTAHSCRRRAAWSSAPGRSPSSPSRPPSPTPPAPTNFLLTFYKLSTSYQVFTHRQFRCFVSFLCILVPQTPSLLCRVRSSLPLHLLENGSSQVESGKKELETFCSGLRCFILSSNLYLASSRDLKKVKRWIKSSSPFKVSNSLFSVIAQLMDVHYASVPHHVGRVDEIAWMAIIFLGFFDDCLSPVKSGTSL